MRLPAIAEPMMPSPIMPTDRWGAISGMAISTIYD
jgi:hypothetical protein